MVFNSLASTGDVTKALESMSTLHNHLLSYHGFLSGFTFLGMCQWTSIKEVDEIVTAYTAALVGSFLCCSMGSMISFIALEYFNGMRGESTTAIVFGILKYWRFFYLSDILAFLSTALFLSSVEVMIYKSLPKVACIAINIVTGLLAVLGVAAFYIIIPAKQRYSRGGVKTTRKIYVKSDDMSRDTPKLSRVQGA